MKRTIAVVLLALTPWIVIPAAAEKKSRADLAPINQPISGAVPVVGPDAGSLSYRVEIPDEAFVLSIDISRSPADLDIAVYRDGDLLTYSELSDYNESLRLTRLTDPALESGFYDVEIAYQYSRPPVVDGAELTEVPFELTFSVAELSVREELRPGQAARGTLEPDAGMADLYRIEVPTGTLALRLDVSDTEGDLDLFLSRDTIPTIPNNADYLSQSIRSTETLIVDRDSTPSLRPGTYYALVLDQVSDSFPTDYTLTVHDRREAPPLLDTPVEIPTAEAPLDRAILATVELLTDYGGGSGVIVSPDGYILTNWHVVVDDAGDAATDITVGFSRDPALPATEDFQAEVVRSAPDRDLALLRIVSGRYGQSLPRRAAFPHVAVRRDTPLHIGDDLRFVGYPWIGSTGSRATVTFTRGTVAGFQAVPFGRLIKTDAVINEGSSGGAALDRDFRLVGLPTEVVGFDTSQIAYVYPVTAMPDEWLRIIGAE